MMMFFDHNKPQYRCLCGRWHAAKAAVIIGQCFICLSAVSVLGAIIVMNAGRIVLYGPFVFALLNVPAAGLMIHGVKDQVPWKVVPFLTLLVIEMLGSIAGVVLVAIQLSSTLLFRQETTTEPSVMIHPINEDSISQWQCMVVLWSVSIGLLVLGGVLCAWFLYVCLKAYCYVRDRVRARSLRNVMAKTILPSAFIFAKTIAAKDGAPFSRLTTKKLSVQPIRTENGNATANQKCAVYNVGDQVIP